MCSGCTATAITFMDMPAFHELHIMGALSITISCAVLGSSIVRTAWCCRFCLPAICIHLDKVHCTIEATRHEEHVGGHGEFPVLQLEHLVLVGSIQHIDAGSKVGAVRVFCDKVQLDAVINLLNPIRRLVLLCRVAWRVSTVQMPSRPLTKPSIIKLLSCEIPHPQGRVFMKEKGFGVKQILHKKTPA